jgi:Outer membrane protein beta-barrel domain
MRISPVIIAILIAGKITAQENTTASDNSVGKLSIGVVGSTDYCYRTIHAGDTAGIGSIFNYFRDTEIPFYGFSSGIAASYRINNHFSIDVTPRFSVNRYKTEDFLFIDQNGTQIGEGYITYSNKFISVPIGIQYHSSVEKIGFTGGISVVPEYALGIWSRGYYQLPDTYDIDDSPTKENIKELRSFIFSGMIHAGLEYRTGKFNFQALPQAKLAFMKQATDVPVNRRLWSVGLELRVLYTI